MSTDNASGKGKDRVERAEQPGRKTSATKVTVTNSPAAPPDEAELDEGLPGGIRRSPGLRGSVRGPG